MPLTHTLINKLTPSDKCTPNRPDKYTDGDGLQLWVRHTGNKVWISAYRHAGKQQTLTLGKYPTLSLQDARSRNLDIKRMLADGTDPKAVRDEKKAQADGSKRFDTIAQAWFDERQSYLAPSTHSRDYSSYLRDIKPAIGDKHIDDILPPDILAIGKAIEARGAYDMAKRAIRQVGQIYQHAIRHGITYHNPASNLAEAIKPQKTNHHNRIAFKDLPRLLNDIASYNGHPLVKHGMMMLCYTFVRTQELRLMEWAEIDFNNRLWTIPADKMKARRKHIVPLAPQVIAILQEIKSYGINDKHVFFNTTTQKPLSQNAFIKALYNMGYKGEMTGHGFRGLASTALHERGYKHEAIELQLAHDKDNKISKAYDGSQHLAYRIAMMTEWADLIDDAKAGR